MARLSAALHAMAFVCDEQRMSRAVDGVLLARYDIAATLQALQKRLSPEALGAVWARLNDIDRAAIASLSTLPPL